MKEIQKTHIDQKTNNPNRNQYQQKQEAKNPKQQWKKK